LLLVGAAGAYPTKPVRLVAGNAPGAATDTVARIFATKLSEVMGQQFIVDNRPGAGGVIGMEVVARSAPDGYTLYICGIGQSIRPAMHKKLPFDTLRDFTRISLYGAVPNVLVVHPSVPARSVAEFVAYAKANPGRLKYASSGVGLSPHLTMEFLKTTAGIDLIHIPYKSGAQGNNEVLAGQVQTQFANLPSHLPNIKAGRIRALAVTTAHRNAQLPEVPSFVESGYPGFEVTVWYGLCGPARLPGTVIATLLAGIGKTLAAPDLRRRFAAQGVEPRPVGGSDFDAFFKNEVARWAKVVKEAGIAPE
jgi:tripartite-type tricarboxylate transporter receptor subunit TctC